MYKAISEVLQRLGTPLSAAETHGLLCGVLCMAHTPSPEQWLTHVIPDDIAVTDAALTDQCRRVLISLQHHTQNQLETFEYGFAPLLPADTEPLAARGVALGHWCEGFLYGLGLGGLKDLSGFSTQVREFLADLTEFTRITEASAGTEADEEAYMQLFEYLRTGVMILYTEKQTGHTVTPTLH